MDIPSAIGWVDGFVQNTSGDGAVSIGSDGVASLSSGAGTGSAYFEKIVKSTPGEVLSFSCMARRISGSDDTSGALKVEWPADSSGEESVVFVTSPEWREYEVSIAAGLANGATDHFTIAVGTFTADGGEIEVAIPRIKISGSRCGALRCHAYGLVRFNAGAPALDADYVSHGITALAYDAPTKTLSLTTPRAITGITAGAAPLLFCQVTTESAVTAYTAKIGEFARATGVCKVKFYDMASGAEADISAIAGQFYVSVMLVL